MDQPLVSIIINNYNYAKYLREAIESALSQTYANTEVIVVDDGSTDKSQDIITSYGSQIVPILKQNGGQASAFNIGFAASRGEIVIFLDADDYLFAYAVEQVVASWKPDVAKMHYRLELVDAVGNFLDIAPPPEVPFDSDDVLPILLEKGCYTTQVTSGNAFSRSALAQILPIPEAEFRICADGYLNTVVPFYGKILALEEPLGIYRKHGSNVWSTASQELFVDKFHKSIEHDLLKHKFLLDTAIKFGHKISPELGSCDYLHLISRLVSLRLDPQNHPLAGDSPLNLTYNGYWAIWKYTEFPRKRKLILSSWFIWVGLMPKPLVIPAVNWLLNTQTRPQSIDWLLKKIRTFTS
ncbi:MAG: glycosyltransferase [Mojavia pulchra JT2-VF2]|jgi:glycosyltransferase involved in cell wall biosynthesis|uniref:Glycosyltransferase n=1 Tax=Mojavia pulchra JT2-VF2 TaxID=287848 RepID=A0A951UJY9_9NOST|nr:glycosyltransferase [Mojavia pulchra JT2-VF2]